MDLGAHQILYWNMREHFFTQESCKFTGMYHFINCNLIESPQIPSFRVPFSNEHVQTVIRMLGIDKFKISRWVDDLNVKILVVIKETIFKRFRVNYYFTHVIRFGVSNANLFNCYLIVGVLLIVSINNFLFKLNSHDRWFNHKLA